MGTIYQQLQGLYEQGKKMCRIGIKRETDNAYQVQITKLLWSYQCTEEMKTKCWSHSNKADVWY